jgi:hypothetical protein
VQAAGSTAPEDGLGELQHDLHAALDTGLPTSAEADAEAEVACVATQERPLRRSAALRCAS